MMIDHVMLIRVRVRVVDRYVQHRALPRSQWDRFLLCIETSFIDRQSERQSTGKFVIAHADRHGRFRLNTLLKISQPSTPPSVRSNLIDDSIRRQT